MKVEKKSFYSWNDFISELGGTLKIIQMLTLFLASFFIFDEFYSYLAKVRFGDEMPAGEAKTEIKNRICAEGIIDLHD